MKKAQVKVDQQWSKESLPIPRIHQDHIRWVRCMKRKVLVQHIIDLCLGRKQINEIKFLNNKI